LDFLLKAILKNSIQDNPTLYSMVSKRGAKTEPKLYAMPKGPTSVSKQGAKTNPKWKNTPSLIGLKDRQSSPDPMLGRLPNHLSRCNGPLGNPNL
jgi:hypothetical protein